METTIAICVPMLVGLIQFMKGYEKFTKLLPIISLPIWMILVFGVWYVDLVFKELFIAGIITTLTANWMYDQGKMILTLFSKKK